MPKNENVVETKDLGNGQRQVTLKVDAGNLESYFQTLQNMPNTNVVVQEPTAGDMKMGKGSVRSRYVPNGNYNPYTSNHTPYTQALKTPIDPHQKVELAVELYHKEPIVGTTIDLMVDFSSSGFTNECDDDDVKKLYDKWCKEVDMQTLIEGVFLEFYRSGNVTIYRSDKDAKVKKVKKNKTKATAEVNGEYKFPAGYTILNPMNVYIEGSLLFNGEIVMLQLNKELIELVKSEKTDKALIKDIPNDILKAIRSGNIKVPLDKNLTSRITRKRQPYERYASPFLERVFEPMMYKQKLRQMDMSTIEGLVNQLVTVTVGNDEYPATDEDLEAVAELFATPNKAYTLFWNHTLNVTFHKPEGIETLNDDKYKQVNEDILAGLGVSRVLLDGQGSNFSTAWVSILSLIERLENARHKVKDWLEKEYKRIADENGLDVYPTVRFNRMNLREDTYIRDVLLAMYDRGLIDEEDILTETGREYQSVVEMKKRNQENSELFYPPEQPFQGGNAGPNGGGREPESGGNYKKRETAPVQNEGKPSKPKSSKAMASYNQLEEDYENELQEYYDAILSDVQETVEQNSEQDSYIIEAMILGTILAMFKSLSKISSRHLYETFDSVLADHDVPTNFDSANRTKNELKTWNDSYVIKLAHDLTDKIKANIDKGISPKDSVAKAFQSEGYRVRLMSQAGIVESVRQAKIQANKYSGMATAIWRTHLDGRECATCHDLNGRQFGINEVPPRPHSGCRCDLDFK